MIKEFISIIDSLLQQTRLIAASVAVALCAVTAVGAELSQKGEQLMQECESTIKARLYKSLPEKGRQLQRLGAAEGNENARLLGESYEVRGIVYLHDTTDVTPRIEAMQRKIEEKEKEGEYRVASELAYTVSLYHHFVNSDYSQSLLYAYKMLDWARKQKDHQLESNALSCLASIYFSKSDSSGIKYAVDAYNLNKEAGDRNGLYVGACNMANYLFNEGKLAEATRYLDEACALAESLRLTGEKSYLDSFRGDLKYALGDVAHAEQFYKSAIEASVDTPDYDKIYSCICYGIFLHRQKRLPEALEIFSKANSLSGSSGITVFTPMILKSLSECYEEMGNDKEALGYYKQYTESYQQVVTETKEREFSILDLRNRVAEEKSKNAVQQLELMRTTRTAIVTGFVLVLLMLVALFGYLHYRRELRANKAAVKRYLENIETEKNLRAQLEDALAERSHAVKSPGLSDDRQSELFLSLERLMTDDKIYRDTELSLEKAADMLGTNRTYLSQVVNEQAGQSFPTYINSFRLKEAIAMLSDPENDEPLKTISYSAGFTTPSGFYALFKQKMGMSPTAFRENIKAIKKTDLIVQTAI